MADYRLLVDKCWSYLFTHITDLAVQKTNNIYYLLFSSEWKDFKFSLWTEYRSLCHPTMLTLSLFVLCLLKALLAAFYGSESRFLGLKWDPIERTILVSSGKSILSISNRLQVSIFMMLMFLIVMMMKDLTELMLIFCF